MVVWVTWGPFDDDDSVIVLNEIWWWYMGHGEISCEDVTVSE